MPRSMRQLEAITALVILACTLCAGYMVHKRIQSTETVCFQFQTVQQMRAGQ